LQALDRDRVPACGRNVDSWKVALTGTIVSPDQQQNVQFTATLWVATQFGAIVIGEPITEFEGVLSGTPHITEPPRRRTKK